MRGPVKISALYSLNPCYKLVKRGGNMAGQRARQEKVREAYRQKQSHTNRAEICPDKHFKA